MSRTPQILLVVSLLLISLTSQISSAQEPSVFVDRVDVNIVNVEVFVTDSDGRHVEGLTVEDFEVFEDGRPVEVTNFYTVERQGPATPTGAPVEATETEDQPSTQPAKIPPEQQLHLLVYIDNFNIRAGNRKRVLASLETFLAQRAAENDRIMLVTFNRSLRTVQPFTDDPQQLSTALAKIRKSDSSGLREDFRRRTASRDIAAALSEPDATGHQAADILQRYIDETRANLLQSVNALQATVRSLAGLQGRKALLYVSDGLPQNPGQTLTEQFFGRQSLNANESALFNRVIREANAQQVTFYAVDARGPTAASSVNAEMTDNVGGGLNRGVLDARRAMDTQEPLIGMSEPTGGASFLNTLNFDVAMTAMAKDFDRFYSLGYSSPGTGDGGYHNIEVKVKRPGLKVRHRSGFHDKPQVERVADRTLSTLMVGAEHNPLGIRLEFDQPAKQGKRYRLPILVRIPIRELTLIPNQGTHEGRLRIFLVVQDSEGGISPLKEFPYPLSIPDDQIATARESATGYLAHLEVRSGEQKIAVGVWDEHAGTESFAHQVILVGNAKKKRKG